jgi:hypothetical protein
MELKYGSFTFIKGNVEIFVLFRPVQKGTTYRSKFGDVVQAKYEVTVTIAGDIAGTWNTRQSPSVTTAKEFIRAAKMDKDQSGKTM